VDRSVRFLVVVGIGLCCSLLARSAHAHDRFSFGLNIWGPPPAYVGPSYYYDPYPYYPPPVVYRRVYVTAPPEKVYVAPAPAPAPVSAKRVRTADPVLVKIGELHSTDNDAREEAAKWLGQVRDPRAVRPLIEVLAHDPDHDVREESARSLGYIGGPDAERALLTASESDPKGDVRHAASKSLSRIAKESGKKIVR
jgi:hypothetical protein